MKISFYFDCLSPYSYVASQLIRKQAWYPKVLYKPVSLPTIMQANKNAPPGAIPNKAAWMQKDLQRHAQMHSFTLNMPATFPFPTKYLNAAIAAQSPNAQAQVMQALLEKVFVKGNVDNEPEAIEAYLKGNSINLPVGWKEKGEKIVEENTKEALEHGAFGVPTFLLVKEGSKPELFFGSDRLDQISFYSKY